MQHSSSMGQCRGEMQEGGSRLTFQQQHRTRNGASPEYPASGLAGLGHGTGEGSMAGNRQVVQGGFPGGLPAVRHLVLAGVDFENEDGAVRIGFCSGYLVVLR